MELCQFCDAKIKRAKITAHFANNGNIIKQVVCPECGLVQESKIIRLKYKDNPPA